MKTKRADVEAKIKAGLRRVQQWLATGKTRTERIANAIERSIPPDCQHPSALEALRCVALAREAATELKAMGFLFDAQANAKDYMLFDDAVEGEKVPVRRKTGGANNAKRLKAERSVRKKNMVEEARKLLRDNKSLSQSDIAGLLAERFNEGEGKESIRNMLTGIKTGTKHPAK